MNGKDTEAAVCDIQMPHINAKVISRQVGFPIAVDGDGIDVVCVAVCKHPPGTNLHHQICWF